MNTADFEKVAGQLARCAVTRDAAEVGHIKQAVGYTDQALQYLSSPAGKYLLGGLGGAGVGALIGATQPKRKGRNALYYGTMGGLGGLGLAHLINSAGGKTPSTTDSTKPGTTPSTTPGTSQGAAAANAAKRKAEASAAATTELLDNFPVANTASAAGAGVAANRLVGRPVAEAIEQSAARRTTALNDAHKIEAQKIQAQNAMKSKRVADAFNRQLDAVGKRNTAALANTAVKARAAEAITGVPASAAIAQLKAQQAAQNVRMNKKYDAAQQRMSKAHTAAEAAYGAKFKAKLGRRNALLNAINLVVRAGVPAAATYGGFQAPAWLQQYISGE